MFQPAKRLIYTGHPDQPVAMIMGMGTGYDVLVVTENGELSFVNAESIVLLPVLGCDDWTNAINAAKAVMPNRD